MTTVESWTLHDEDGAYRRVEPSHPAYQLAQRVLGDVACAKDVVPAAAEKGFQRIYTPVVYVADAAEEVAVVANLEPRLTAPGLSYCLVKGELLPAATDVVLVCCPAAARALERGDYDVAAKLADNPPGTETHTTLHLALEARAWQMKLHEEAFQAFEVLFKCYSLSEELWRLREWMERLPFYLEEDPRMEKYRSIMQRQLGHHVKGTRAWYEEGSPVAGVGVEWVTSSSTHAALRVRWLMEECRRAGYKRVAELGSVEGLNLFALIQQASDIEWHGYELSKVAVARGRELAREVGLEATFHLHHWDELEGEFDAIALFEILEHNEDPVDLELLQRAWCHTRAEGTVYVTTPHGNWSGFDKKTRDLGILKDHINAFTVLRMQKLLTTFSKQCAIDVLQVQQVHNPNIAEANSWVHASFRVRK